MEGEHNVYTRREFGKLALAVPAASVLGRSESIFGAFAPSRVAALTGSGGAGAQAKPNSLIDGVQIGTITYSYRSMPDQSAEATLKYIVDSGISGDRADGRTGRELCRRTDGSGPRRWRRSRPRRRWSGPGWRRRWPRRAAAHQAEDGSWNGQPCVRRAGRPAERRRAGGPGGGRPRTRRRRRA